MPDALRDAGAVIHVMADVYGERIGQGLRGEEWLHDAGERGWVVLMKDSKIRYRPAELQVVIDHGLRAFCLTTSCGKTPDDVPKAKTPEDGRTGSLAAIVARGRPIGAASDFIRRK